ncbi:MAG: hypothetical protein Q9217_002432 [Psora testacea]
MSKLSHEERTAADPREPDVHAMTIHIVEQISATQLDPQSAKGTKVVAYPSPLISILTHLHQSLSLPPNVQFLYSTRSTQPRLLLFPNRTLFLPRLLDIFTAAPSPNHNLHLFLTSPPTIRTPNARRVWQMEQENLTGGKNGQEMIEFTWKSRRGKRTAVAIKEKEKMTDCNMRVFERFGRIGDVGLEEALGPVEEREGVLAYVCGPPGMTDWAVAKLKGAEGMKAERVLCEKWV